jgi:flagellar biosynthesis protein FliP
MTRAIQWTAGLGLTVALIAPGAAWAATAIMPNIPQSGSSGVVRTALVLTLMAFLPTLLICTTSFLRIIVVLAMIRHAFGMPQTPPNAVLTSLALFMTIFTMGPVLNQVSSAGLQPLLDGKANITEAMEAGSTPLKTFMLRQTREKDIATIYSLSGTELPATAADVEMQKLIPAFMLNELRVAFSIGFVILLPFLLIDLVVSSILLALGMMMVPPTTISLPIKILMFLLIDGWSLVIQGLAGSFR